MVITNQGVAIQPGSSIKTTCSFENRPICCVYKTGTKYASKDGIELVVLKAFWEVLLEVLSFGFGVAVLVPSVIVRGESIKVGIVRPGVP